MPRLTAKEPRPLSTLIACSGDLMHNGRTSPTTIITHGTRGARRGIRSSPFLGVRHPRSATSAGARRRSSATGLGLAMGAKARQPEQASASTSGGRTPGHRGFTGMDFETAAREAHSDPVRPLQQLLDGDRAQDHEGRHAEVPEQPTSAATTAGLRQGRSDAMASGSTEPDEIVPAIKRGGSPRTREGRAPHACFEFHHGEGRGLFYVFLSPGRGMGPRTFAPLARREQ